MAKRSLNHEEMQALRRLCLWSGLVMRTYDDAECRRLRFLARRGLVACMDGPVKSSREFVITEEGRIEVAKSGRFTLYEGKYLVDTWRRITKILEPVFKYAYLFANPIRDWMDPERPRDNLVQLQRLRYERSDWRSHLYGDADWSLADAMLSIKDVLEGESEDVVEHRIGVLQARVDKLVRLATSAR